MDFSIPAHIRIAERYYEKGILPDNNPEFAKDVLDVFLIYNFSISFHHIQMGNYKLDIDLSSFILKKLAEFLLESSRYELILKEFADDENKKRLLKNLSRVRTDVKSFAKEANKFQDKSVREKEVHRAKLINDNKGMAALIWELKKVIEQEIQRRRNCRPKLSLSPQRRKRDIDFPSYRKQWKLVTDLIHDFYSTYDNITFPYGKEGIRKIAYRYKDEFYQPIKFPLS